MSKKPINNVKKENISLYNRKSYKYEYKNVFLEIMDAKINILSYLKKSICYMLRREIK